VTGRGTDAVQAVLKAVELEPQNSDYMDHLARAVYQSDAPAQTISNFLRTAQTSPKVFENFLQAADLDVNHADFLNRLAWDFATYPDAQLRNGNDAIRLATRACEITGYRVAPCLSTLAVADAEAGKFDDAVSNCEKAIALTEQSGPVDALQKSQELLKLFRNHQAYHEKNP
jgi:tetratricopeptide (TPR) repeat protein